MISCCTAHSLACASPVSAGIPAYDLIFVFTLAMAAIVGPAKSALKQAGSRRSRSRRVVFDLTRTKIHHYAPLDKSPPPSPSTVESPPPGSSASYERLRAMYTRPQLRVCLRRAASDPESGVALGGHTRRLIILTGYGRRGKVDGDLGTQGADLLRRVTRTNTMVPSPRIGGVTFLRARERERSCPVLRSKDGVHGLEASLGALRLDTQVNEGTFAGSPVRFGSVHLSTTPSPTLLPSSKWRGFPGRRSSYPNRAVARGVCYVSLLPADARRSRAEEANIPVLPRSFPTVRRIPLLLLTSYRPHVCTQRPPYRNHFAHPQLPKIR